MEGNRIRVFSRRGNEYTERVSGIVDSLARLPGIPGRASRGGISLSPGGAVHMCEDEVIGRVQLVEVDPLERDHVARIERKRVAARRGRVNERLQGLRRLRLRLTEMGSRERRQVDLIRALVEVADGLAAEIGLELREAYRLAIETFNVPIEHESQLFVTKIRRE